MQPYQRAVQAGLAARAEASQAFHLHVINQGITCTPGCNHCCNYPIPISILEGLIIRDWLDQNRMWTQSLKDRIKKAADLVTGLTYDIWLASITPCVFLGETGLCTIYEARPFLCRSCASTGDPENCHPHRLAENRGMVFRLLYVLGFQQTEAQILSQWKLKMVTMPIPTAILAADHVFRGDVTMEEADSAIFLEHLGRM